MLGHVRQPMLDNHSLEPIESREKKKQVLYQRQTRSYFWTIIKMMKVIRQISNQWHGGIN